MPFGSGQYMVRRMQAQGSVKEQSDDHADYTGTVNGVHANEAGPRLARHIQIPFFKHSSYATSKACD
jgi:hypothetical protein